MILWEKVEMCFEEVSLFFYFWFKFWLSLAHCILGNDIRAEDFPKLKRITFRQNILIGRGGFGDVSNFGNGVTCVFHFLVLFWKLVFAITRATFIFWFWNSFIFQNPRKIYGRNILLLLDWNFFCSLSSFVETQETNVVLTWIDWSM